MNVANIIGRMTRDPELRYLSGGKNTAVVKFTLAVDRNLSKEKREEALRNNQPTADFISVVAWAGTAELIGNYGYKGQLVGVEGRIQTGSYEKDGQRVYTTEIVANRVHFLSWSDRIDNKGKQEHNENLLDNIEGFYTIDNDDIPF